DFSPSALTRSSRPSLTKTGCTLIPLSLVKSSSKGRISPGSRVVYRLTSAAEAAAPSRARPANATPRISGRGKRLKYIKDAPGAKGIQNRKEDKGLGKAVNSRNLQAS